LYKALREERIFAAGLDTFDQEPPDPQNPLFTLQNVVLSPACCGSNLGELAEALWPQLLPISSVWLAVSRRYGSYLNCVPPDTQLSAATNVVKAAGYFPLSRLSPSVESRS
jgi:hypothetical protein